MADRFATAYLARDPRTAAFLPSRFDSRADRAQAVSAAAERSISPVTQDVLHQLNQPLAPSSARDAHLEALGRPGTVCVVTGQQIGLFLGPLYTVYKAAAAIVTARALAAETGRAVVPIFWLQTEDHDFPEVATAYAPHADQPRAFTASGEADSRVAMAHRRLGDDVAVLIAGLREEFGGLEFAEPTLARLGAHYRPGARWVEAFAGWLAELFAPEGLVVFDPRTPAAAALCAPIHQRALTEADGIATALVERNAALVEAGFFAPVHVRPGAPLSFFHPQGPEGPRFRVGPNGDGRWSIVGADATADTHQLTAALASDPACFSTSALLRPVLQDTLLPTAAFVGGPGEIDYFAQMAPVYGAYGLPMPVVVPRARFAVVEPKVHKGLDQLQLPLEALARPQAELLDTVACRPEHLPDPDALQARMLESLRTELAALAPELDELQPGLRKAADRTVESVERSCGKFVDKYRGALNQADTQRVQAVRRLKSALYPMNAPQERILSLPYFAARYGGRTFIEKVLAGCRPYHPDLEALQP